MTHTKWGGKWKLCALVRRRRLQHSPKHTQQSRGEAVACSTGFLFGGGGGRVLVGVA